MSRNPILKRKKHYQKYETDVIEAALKEYEESKQSFKFISDKHNIPKSVLHRHYTRFMKRQGGQTALNQETEKYIIQYLNVCSEWGYPLDTYDLRLLVKGYLDRAGTVVKKFKDNMPGPDFIRSFLKRHKQDISLRLGQNIKRVRAAVSPEIINQYFDELGLSIDGVPLSNVVNYDETNLSDDPGRRKIICKRGAKYPERVMNHSKGITSLMIAAAADGTLLAPYVVYKSQHLYDTWTTGGPKGCRYNRTASGWFDGNTFEEWVRTVIYSFFKDKPGKKILIGDNLSSHLSIDLIRECKERDIHFVFLPPNSTHVTQPLDVAFFRPMKMAWRDILFHWKKTDGRVQPSVPKPCFPQLLKKLLQRINENAKQNILSGFSKTGISPLDRKRVLDRLPNNDGRDDSIFSKESMDETVLAMLREMRYGTGNIRVYNKRKMLHIKPGKSVGSESDYVCTDSSEPDNEICPTTSEEKILPIKISKRRTVARNAKNDDKETTDTKGKIGANKKTKVSEVEIVKETRIEDGCNPFEVKKIIKGKGVGKKSVKYEEQKKNDINIENNIEKMNKNVNQEEVKKKIKGKGVGKKSVKYEEQKENDINIENNIEKMNKNVNQEEVKKKIKGKGVGKKSVKYEEQKENDINIENSIKNVNQEEVKKKIKGKGVGKKSVKKHEEQKEDDINIENTIETMNVNVNQEELQYFNESTFSTTDLDYENMPVYLDDGIQLSEVIVDNLETENNNRGCKIKILSNEIVSPEHLSKAPLHLKKVSFTEPINSQCQLKKNQKNRYYKNDEEIIRDLMDLDSE